MSFSQKHCKGTTFFGTDQIKPTFFTSSIKKYTLHTSPLATKALEGNKKKEDTLTVAYKKRRLPPLDAASFDLSIK